MKKFLCVFAAIVLSSNISVAITKEVTNIDTNCFFYATDAAAAEANYYGNMTDEEVADALGWYWDQCEAAGGNVLMPVFV